MATEPEAIEALLNLQEQYPSRLTVRRYASNTSQTFHPKAWLFSFRSGPGSTVVGSSNLTQGALDATCRPISCSMVAPRWANSKHSSTSCSKGDELGVCRR